MSVSRETYVVMVHMSHHTERHAHQKEGFSRKGAIGRDRPSAATAPSNNKVDASVISGEYQIGEYALHAWPCFREKQFPRL